MAEIKPSDLNSLYSWMNFIINTKEATLTDTDCSLNVFGESDGSYLVINQYKSDKESTEYFFKSEDSKNKLESLLSCLSTVDYSISMLLDKLSRSNYTNCEIGEYLTIGKIKVFKEHVKSN